MTTEAGATATGSRRGQGRQSTAVRAFQRYMDAQGGNWATIIAWNAFVAFFPMMLITVTVVGILLHNPGARMTIEQQVLAAFPRCDSSHSTLAGRCQVIDALDSFRERAGLLGIIGALGLLWSGSSLFSALDQGLSALYASKSRDFVRQKLMAVGMILLFTLLAVPLLFSGSLLSILDSLPYTPHAFRSGPVSLLLQIAAGIVDASVLFAVIFYVVPNRRQHLRRVLPGALVAGISFEAITLLFPLYFSFASRSPEYGQVFTLVFLLMFYFYILGQIFMIAGAVNAELDPTAEGAHRG